METDNDRAVIGGNNPPDPIEILRAQLQENHADLLKRSTSLLGMLDRLPASMDDEWERKMSDAIKACNAFTKECEAMRLDGARPYRALIAAIDGFFHGLATPVDRLKTKLNADYLTPYKLEREARERREREAEARLKREREAEARRIAEEEARLVREAKEREAAAAREADRLKRERAEAAERRAREELEAREKAEADRQAAIRREEEVANNKRKAAAAAKERERIEAAEKVRKAAALEEAKAAREKERADKAEAERLAEETKRERREQERAAAEARDAAVAAEREKNKADRAERANAAELSRSRSDLGAVSSLRTVYDFEVEQPSLVPRQYLTVDRSAIGQAIKAATHDGKCDLTIEGVRIFPMRDAVTR